MEFDIEAETAYNECNTFFREYSKYKGEVCVREIDLYNFQLSDLPIDYRLEFLVLLANIW